MFIAALAERASRHGAAPFLTSYRFDDDSRIELSGTTFANWVDKTANLIVDLGHEDGDPITVALGATHPGHWVTLVWIAAAWQRGCPVSLDGPADLVIVGPGSELRGEQVTVMCSLHPLGRGLVDGPGDVVDYVEVFAQPDLHDEAIGVGVPVWEGSPIPRVEPSSDRLLISDPQAGWDTIAAALVAPALGGGSTVIVTGFDGGALDMIAVSERARVR